MVLIVGPVFLGPSANWEDIVTESAVMKISVKDGSSKGCYHGVVYSYTRIKRI